MPKYRAVVRVKLRDEFRPIVAFTKEQAENYFWDQLGENYEDLDLGDFSIDDVEVAVYEVREG